MGWILKRIDEIEDTISKLPIAAIGHNKPPEPIESPPLTKTEIREINFHINLMREQPAVPTQVPTDVGVAARRLRTIGKAMLAYSAMKTLDAATAPLWEKLGMDLTALSDLIVEWIKPIFT